MDSLKRDAYHNASFVFRSLAQDELIRGEMLKKPS